MLKLRKYDIIYKNSVLNWDEALPLGNGKLGTLVYGDGPLRLSVDRVDLIFLPKIMGNAWCERMLVVECKCWNWFFP